MDTIPSTPGYYIRSSDLDRDLPGCSMFHLDAKGTWRIDGTDGWDAIPAATVAGNLPLTRLSSGS